MKALLIAGAAAAVMLAGGQRKRRAKGLSTTQRVGADATLLNSATAMKAINLSEPFWPEMTFDIPFGAGIASPLWPLSTNHRKKYVVSYRTVEGEYVGNAARRFMAYRGDGRYHVGIDLYASPGDAVVATEDGTVVSIYGFYHGSYCLIVQCDSGLVINYAEVKQGSWHEFGVSKGSRIRKGQGIARIGVMSGGSSMLHFETYMPPTPRNQKYHGGDTGPILNPTYYLLLAAYLETTGRRFADVNCGAIASLNRPVPDDLKAIEAEEKAIGEDPSDSVLVELLQPPDSADQADGP